MKTRVLVLAAIGLLIRPAVAGPRVITLDACDYASDAAARAAWKPIVPPTPPIRSSSDGGRGALKMPCNFRASDHWRVGWDREGKWDLSGCQTIELDLVVDRAGPAQMIVYFHSGGGWYGCNFSPPPGRSTVTLPRKRFKIEEKPAGWDTIDRIRLAVIRNQAEDRAILLTALRGLHVPVHVTLYRNDAGIRQEDGIPEYVQRMADALDRLGVAYEILGDGELAAARLADRKVIILPLNPRPPRPATAAIEKFVAGGGKLIVCYCPPDPLGKLLGLKVTGSIKGRDRNHAFSFRPAGERQPIRVTQQSWWARRIEPAGGTEVRAFWIDKDGKTSADPAVTRNVNGFFIGHVLTPPDQAGKDRLVMALIGELWPGVWRSVYERRAGRFGRLCGFADAEALVAATRAQLKGAANRQQILASLNASESLRREAETAAAGGRYAQAAGSIRRADQALLHAFAASVPDRPGEFRAVWCHDPAGVRGLSWDEALRALSDAGFNAVIPNMLWGGSAAYKSKVLPRATQVDRDLLAECLAAAAKHGVAVHVWKVNWRLWWNTPAAFKRKLRTAGRLQVHRTGEPTDWLCPSHPDNFTLELESLLEVVRNYRVGGIHFDYIRYPGLQGCYCAGCRKRFETEYKVKAKNWPADVIGGALREKYLQFRRDNITRLVAAVSEQARKIRPGVKISAAVFWNWPSARNNVAQDWKLWVEKGYLDFVCPMQYTDSAALFDAQTRQTLAWVGGRRPLMPGIGATLGLAPDGALQQVLIARRHGAAGFVLFNYGPALLEHLSLLNLGATRTKSKWAP